MEAAVIAFVAAAVAVVIAGVEIVRSKAQSLLAWAAAAAGVAAAFLASVKF
jgi:hypothetical protein